jgi:polyhydroxybutyrate depolymerase
MGRYRRISPILIGVVCLFASCAARAGMAMNWTIDGVEREALIFPPSKTTETGNAPVVFAFHWHGGTMQEAAEGARFQELWPEAIVVYMQGLPTQLYVDPSGLRNGWQQEPGQSGDRDLKFFDAVLATVRANFLVNDRRIYATGFSNGGIFTYLLWGARGKIFAAFAPVAGEIFPAVHLSVPRPLLHIAGERDDVVPFAKQQQSIKISRELDGTAEKGEVCGQYCLMYSSTKGAPVVTYIHPGGHEYPPGASEMIVKFLKTHTLTQ